MTTTGGTGREPGGTTWAGEAIVTTCVIVALLPLGFLHVNGIGVVDPLHDVISDYVFEPGGYALLAVAALSLAVASVVLATGLGQAGLPGPTPARGAARECGRGARAGGGLPDPPGRTSAGLVSTVHRAAGGWVFAMLPLAAWMVARRARSAPAWRPAAPA